MKTNDRYRSSRSPIAAKRARARAGRNNDRKMLAFARLIAEFAAQRAVTEKR